MDYNTDRKQLILPEYGRIIQEMVDYALTLKKKEDRQRCAGTIVKAMAHFCPQIKEMPDAQNILWDHLAKMAHYELDIDYPVEITREEEITAKPEGMAYPMTSIRMRHYGYLMEELIRKLEVMDEGDKKEELIELTLNQMRKNLYFYTGEAMDEEKVLNDLAEYTKGKIQGQPGIYQLVKNIASTGISHQAPTGGKKRKKNRV